MLSTEGEPLPMLSTEGEPLPMLNTEGGVAPVFGTGGGTRSHAQGGGFGQARQPLRDHTQVAAPPGRSAGRARKQNPPLPRMPAAEWARALAAPWRDAVHTAALLSNWRRLVRAELDAGWGQASSCGRRAGVRRAEAQGFVSVRNAREQMHKSKWVALDALFIAGALNRALIEPSVADSRLGKTRVRHGKRRAEHQPARQAQGVVQTPGWDPARRSDGERWWDDAPSAAGGGARGRDESPPRRRLSSGGGRHTPFPVDSRNATRPPNAPTKTGAPAVNSTPAANSGRAANSTLAVNSDPFGRLLLRHYWDLEPLCAAFDIAPPSSYSRGARGWAREKVRISPYKRHLGIGRFKLRTHAAVRRAFGRVNRTARVLELDGWWRSVSNRDATSSAGGRLGYEGMRLGANVWELNPAYTRIARLLVLAFLSPSGPPAGVSARLSVTPGRGRRSDAASVGGAGGAAATQIRPAGGVGGFLAVQWRSEDSTAIANANETTARADFAPCAGWAGESIRRVMRDHNLTAVFLATDLRQGASTTYGVSEAQQAALTRLYAAVPALGGEASARLRQLIDAIGDSGVRAGIEAAICVQGRALLSTAVVCQKCRRAVRCSKRGSAFAKYILERRQDYALSPGEPLFS